jgi:CheY-like chemotaxis protein
MLLDSQGRDAAAIRAFVVADKNIAATFEPLFRELGIVSQESTDPLHVADELDRTKYEALVLDYEMNSDAAAIIDRARANPSNRNAVVFAIVNGKAHRQEAFLRGANFVFERPLVIEEVLSTVRTARDLMVHERRAYFRCSVELSVLLVEKSSGKHLNCMTMNISKSGMAVKTPMPLQVAGEVELRFSLTSEHASVHAIGTVVWDDKHGMSGISFRCETTKMQADLNSWLEAQFVEISTPHER